MAHRRGLPPQAAGAPAEPGGKPLAAQLRVHGFKGGGQAVLQHHIAQVAAGGSGRGVQRHAHHIAHAEGAHGLPAAIRLQGLVATLHGKALVHHLFRLHMPEVALRLAVHIHRVLLHLEGNHGGAGQQGVLLRGSCRHRLTIQQSLGLALTAGYHIAGHAQRHPGIAPGGILTGFVQHVAAQHLGRGG